MFNKLVFIVLLSLVTVEAAAEIKSKKALMEIFEGCIEEPMGSLAFGLHLDYCACITKEVSFGMNLEEAMLLGMNAMAANDEDEAMRIMASNSKVREYVAKCALRLYD